MASHLNKDTFVYKQDKKNFIQDLHRFHNNRGAPFNRIPSFLGREVDLYMLYRRVIALGGWRKVNDEEHWEEILQELQFPRACSNAAHALKQIYIRYLDVYEKLNFHGEDISRAGVDYDDSGPARKKNCAPLFGVATTYNYDQHKVSGLEVTAENCTTKRTSFRIDCVTCEKLCGLLVADTVRQNCGMSRDLVKLTEYDKLEKALLSGLQNEVDFVLNVCTLLSNESRHVLHLEKSNQLLHLLLGHVGIFEKGSGSLEKLYENGWRKSSRTDFIMFWYDTVQDEVIRDLISYTRTKPRKKRIGHEVLNLDRDVGVHDTEGQRIMQLAVIIRNLSFEEDNKKYLSSDNLVFRFLLLCVYGSYSSLRQIALDTLGNLSSQLLLESVIFHSTKLMMRLIKKCLSSSDKVDVVRGLEIVSNLCQVDANDVVLAENLEDEQYHDIVKFLTVYDIQIIVQSLEALYQLSELGEETTTKIASVKHAVDLLVRLITVEAQSYGPNSLVGIKVVEFCPASELSASTTVLPSVQALPPTIPTQSFQQITTASTDQTSTTKHITSTPVHAGSDLESTTCNWLQAAYELKDSSSIAQLHLYADYINFCKKYSLPNVLPSHSFFNCVHVVFPKVTVTNVEKEGLKEVTYSGLCRRLAPLPFAITCAGAVGKRSVVQSPAFQRLPNIQCLDLTQTPTLRERLLAPPRVLQSCPSIHLGDNITTQPAAFSNQQQELAPSSCTPKAPGPSTQRKPASESTSKISPVTSTISVQIPGTPVSQPQAQKSLESCKTSVYQTVQFSTANQLVLSPDFQQSVQYQAVASEFQGTAGTITNAQELSAMISNQILVNPADTNLIKTLLAKKLRHNQAPSQGLRNIAPKPGSITTGSTVLQLPQLQPKPQIQLQYYNTNQIPQPFGSPPLAVYPPVEGPLIGNPPVASLHSLQQIYQTNLQAATLPPPPPLQSSQPQNTSMVQNPQVQSPIPSTKKKKPDKLSKKKAPTSPGQSVSSAVSSPASAGSSKVLSPKCKPSHGSRPSSPRASSPRSPRACELEVCGEVERAKDIVKSGTEAKIERVENSCLKKHLAKIHKEKKQSIPSSSVLEANDFEGLNCNDEGVITILSQVNVQNSNQLLTSDLPQSDRSLNKNEDCAKSETVDYESKLLEERNNSAFCSSSAGTYGESSSQPYHISTGVSKNCLSQISRSSSIVQNEDSSDTVHPHACSIQSSSEGICSSSGIPIDILDTNSQSSDARSENITETICANIDMGSGNVLETICSSLGIQSEDDSEVDYSMDMQSQQLPETLCASLNVQPQNVSQVFGVVAGSMSQPIISSSNVSSSLVPAENISQIVHSSSAVKQSHNIMEANIESQVTNVYTGIITSSVPVNVPTVISPWSLSNQPFRDSYVIMKEKSRKDLSSTFEQISTSAISRQLPNTIIESRDLVRGKPDEYMLNGSLSSPDYCNTDQIPSPLPPDSNIKLHVSNQIMNGIGCKNAGNSNSQKDLNRKASEQITKMNGIVRHIGNGDFVETEDIKMDTEDRMDAEELVRLRKADTAKLDQDWASGGGVCVSQDKLNIDMSMPSNGIESNMEVDSVISQCFLQNQAMTENSDKLNFVSPHKMISDSGQTLVNVLAEQETVHNPAKNVLYTNNSAVATVNLIVPVLASSVETLTTHIVSQDLGATLSVQSKLGITGKQFSDPARQRNTGNKLLLDNRLLQSKSNDLCGTRLIPTPDHVHRDSELSCDSVSSSTAETVSDKHSKSPMLSPCVVKVDLKKTPKLSDSGQSPRVKSREKKAKKRSRNATGSTDSRASSTSSCTVVTELHCQWSSCKRFFDTAKSVYLHVYSCHLKWDQEGVCKWGGCETLKRKKWSLLTHVQDHHCSEFALIAAAQRRQQSSQSGTPVLPVKVPALVYPNDAALQAIRRFSSRQPFPELMETREGPVTKHIRLTSALILRNLARYSAVGRSLIKRHEQHINFCAMSALESSNALANCLWEVLHDH